MIRSMWLTMTVLLLVFGMEAGAAECRGGQLGAAPAPQDVTGYELAKQDVQFRAAHARLAGIPGWARTWEGPMSPARRYQAPGGLGYIVVDTCAPHDCGNEMFYGVWKPAGSTYGALRYTKGEWVEVGRLDDGMRVALVCTIETDRAAADQVRAYLQAHPFKAPWER